MKVVIAGSRIIDNRHLVKSIIYQTPFNITEVVSGHANGVDLFGEEWASENDIPVKIFIPDWDTHGKSAGHIRNYEMAKYADAAIIIQMNGSKGAASMVKCMQRVKKPYYLFSFSVESVSYEEIAKKKDGK